MENSTETRSQITIPPLALPKSGTVEDLSSSQPVTQAPAGSFLFCFFNIAHTYPVVKPLFPDEKKQAFIIINLILKSRRSDAAPQL